MAIDLNLDFDGEIVAQTKKKISFDERRQLRIQKRKVMKEKYEKKKAKNNKKSKILSKGEEKIDQ